MVQRFIAVTIFSRKPQRLVFMSIFMHLFLLPHPLSSCTRVNTYIFFLTKVFRSIYEFIPMGHIFPSSDHYFQYLMIYHPSFIDESILCEVISFLGSPLLEWEFITCFLVIFSPQFILFRFIHPFFPIMVPIHKDKQSIDFITWCYQIKYCLCSLCRVIECIDLLQPIYVQYILSNKLAVFPQECLLF